MIGYGESTSACNYFTHEQCSKELRKFSYHSGELWYELLLINACNLCVCVYLYMCIIQTCK